MMSIPLSQISGFVQNVFHPNLITIYYKKWSLSRNLISSTYLPQHFETINGRVCEYMLQLLNGLTLRSHSS